MSSDDLLMRIDGDGRIVSWSLAAARLFGRPQSRVIGSDVTRLLRGTNDEEPVIPLAACDSLTVRPVLSGAALTWEVRIAESDLISAGDLSILRALFTHSPLGLYLLDQELRIVRVNDAVRRSPVYESGSSIGETFPTIGLEDPAGERKIAHQVLTTGVPVLNRVVRTAHRNGVRRRSLALSYVRLEGENGEILGIVASAVDVTARERALQSIFVLEQLRSVAGEQLEVTAVCRELANAVVPAFAGIVVIEVIDDVIRGDEPPVAPVDQDVPLRRTAFQGLVSAYSVGDVRQLPAGTPFSLVLIDLRARLVRVEKDSPWLPADPARANAIARSNAHSLIVAPLAIRGQALGLVSFYRHRDEEPFDEEDIAVAEDICCHAAVHIDNARRYTRERTIAATLKRRLLPQRPVAPSTAAVSHLHVPGQGGGGAWFDVIELAGGRTALILGDVAGRGISTATTMGQLRTVIHSLAAMDLEPDELMARLNDTATRLATERAALPAGDPQHREPLTAGCLIAVYDAVDQTCTFVRAGLTQPYLTLPNGDSGDIAVPAGPLLAGNDHSPFPAATIELPAGSTLAIGNEDILETSDQIRGLVRTSTDRRLEEVCDELSYILGDKADTEKLLLLARAKGLPADRVLTLGFDDEFAAAPKARDATRRKLEDWNVDQDAAFTTELIVSELVGNAVRYGTPPYRLRLILDNRLTCEVRDAGNNAPHLKHARTIDEGGRGLFIIATIADSWGTRYHEVGKTIWAQQDIGSALGPPASSP